LSFGGRYTSSSPPQAVKARAHAQRKNRFLVFIAVNVFVVS